MEDCSKFEKDGGVIVAVRQRPLLPRETQAGGDNIITLPDVNVIYFQITLANF